MQRVDCECGRSVRVEAAQAGERITCPYCGALVDVPKAKNRRSEAEAPPPGPPANVPLLVGAAAVFVVLLAIAGVAAFFLLKKPTPPTDLVSNTDTVKETETKTNTDKPTDKKTAKKEGIYVIQLIPPHKVGNVREVVLAGEEWSQFTVIEKGKGERESKPAVVKKPQLRCKIRTLDVDPQGRELAWEFTILSFDTGNRAVAGPATGTVVRAEMPHPGPLGELHFLGAGADLPPAVRGLLTRAAGQRLGYWLTAADDAMFGTVKEQKEGDAWPANPDAINEWYKGTINPEWNRSFAKLTAVSKTGPIPQGTIEVSLAGSAELHEKTPEGFPTLGKTTNEVEGKVVYRLPLKDARGPVEVVNRFEILTKDEGDANIASEELLKENYTLTIQYLPDEPAPDDFPGLPTREGAIRKAAVKWVPGKSALHVRAECASAKDAKVVLVVVFPDGKDKPKAFTLKPRPEAGKPLLFDPQVAVELPAESKGDKCVLQMREVLPEDKLGPVLDSWEVPIHGTAPPAPPKVEPKTGSD